MKVDIGEQAIDNQDMEWRSWGWTVLGVVAATLYFFFPLVLHPSDLLVGPQNGGHNDLSNVFLAFRTFPVLPIAEGAFPFWNPFTLSGAPWLGNPQSALFYPPNWLAVISPRPGTVSWLLCLHHLWGGLGTVLLCRRYGLRHVAALTGGVIYAGAPFLMAQTGEGHFNQICLISWVPWSFLVLERLRNGRPFGVLSMATVLALGFSCGHAQEVYYLVVVLSAAVLLEFVRGNISGNSRQAWGLGGLWTIVGIVTFGLVAFELYPIWLYTQQAVRNSGMTATEASVISIGFENLWQLFSPDVLGGPDDYRGAGDYYWETLCYFGAVPLALSALGLILGRRRAWVWGFAAMGVLTLGFAFGNDLPVFPTLHQYLPGMKLFRAPSRALFFVSFSVAMLAAAGMDGLASLRQATPRKTSVKIWGIFALLSFFLLAGMGLGTQSLPLVSDSPILPEPSQLAIRHTAGWFWLAAGAFAVAMICLSRHIGRLALYGMVIVCISELSVHAGHVLRTIAPADIRENSSLVQFLTRDPGTHRIASSQELLSDREAWQAGLFKIQGYDPVPLVSAAVTIDALFPKEDTAIATLGFNDVNLTELNKTTADLVGLRYVVIEHVYAEEPPGWKLEAIGEMPSQLQLRNETPNDPQRFAVYENASWLPRAYVVGNVRQVIQSEGVEALRNLKPREELLLERDVLPDGKRSEFRAAEISDYAPNRVVTEVALDAPGYLVLSDTWFPGWKARAGDQELPVMRANLSFRAVPLPAGNHRVVWEYTPPGAFLGGIVSLFTLFLVITLSVRPFLKETPSANADMPNEPPPLSGDE